MKRILIPALIALSLAVTACSSSDEDKVKLDGFVGVDGAQKLVDELNGHGIKATTPQPSDPGYVEEVGGTSWDVDVNDDGLDDGINLFPNPEALAAWTEISKAFGGIAVSGDTWAVTLNSRQGRTVSEQLAPQIAKVLGGKVQR